MKQTEEEIKIYTEEEIKIYNEIFTYASKNALEIINNFRNDPHGEKHINYFLSALLALISESLLKNAVHQFSFIDNIIENTKIFLRVKIDINNYNSVEKH